MAQIDKGDFADQCLTMALQFGINAHYLAAAAMMRSELTDDVVGGKVGPYRWTQGEWNSNPDRTSPSLGAPFQPNDITKWPNQVSVFALMALREFNSLLGANGKNPSALELYTRQWPESAADAQLADKLQTACDDTKQSITDAINQQLPDPAVAAPVITDPTKPVAAQPVVTS